MKAYLRSARIAPKKANIIAKMVRGMPVATAVTALERTNKKAARLIEKLIKSAVANASHNDKQDAHVLIVKTVVVNQGTAYHRGVPMARGRMRPMRKFMSHISLTLGIADHETKAEKAEKKAEKKENAKKPSQSKKNPVQTSGSRAKKAEDVSPESSSSAS